MKKRGSTKKIEKPALWVSPHKNWHVFHGKLDHKPGPRKNVESSLFRLVAEKIPFEAIDAVRKYCDDKYTLPNDGVYVAHDSMGYARYVGRGDVFGRLKSHWKAHSLELHYFSVYLIADNNKSHEREVETLLIRAAGPHLNFNDRKKRADLSHGNIHDFEAGTDFFERQEKRGKQKKKKLGRPNNRKV